MKINGKWIGSLFTQESANGDGSTVVFNLTSTPQASGAVFVFLDGLFQHQSVDYTISGAALTFTVAPANAQKINVAYMKKEA